MANDPAVIYHGALEVERVWLERYGTREQMAARRLQEDARHILAQIAYDRVLERIAELSPTDDPAPVDLLEDIFRHVRSIRLLHKRRGATTPDLRDAGLAMARFCEMGSEEEQRRFIELPSEESEVKSS